MHACCHNPDRFNITQTCSYFKQTQICVSLTSHLIWCSTAFMIKGASFNAYMLPQSCVTFQITMTQFQKTDTIPYCCNPCQPPPNVLMHVCMMQPVQVPTSLHVAAHEKTVIWLQCCSDAATFLGTAMDLWCLVLAWGLWAMSRAKV